MLQIQERGRDFLARKYALRDRNDPAGHYEEDPWGETA